MKLIAKPIEILVWISKFNDITPIRFHVLNEKQVWQVIKIDQIISIKEEKKAGNPMIVYKCQSTINGVCKIFELKYEKKTCIWTLFKI